MSATYTALNDLVSLIKDNDTTGYETDIEIIWQEKSVGFMDDRRDRILIYPRNEGVKPFSLHAEDWIHTIELIIEIRSYGDQERVSNIVNNVLGTLKNNVRLPNFIDLLVTGTLSENDTMRNMYKHMINVTYRKHNP